MKAELIKIYAPKHSRDGVYTYQRLGIKLEDGKFAMTDLVKEYRNYARWRPVIESGVGTMIDGVMLLADKKINADSVIYIIQKTN